MTIRRNPILATDSYKFSHYLQYPRRASFVTSYIEARGSFDPEIKEVVAFGLQAFIREYLSERVTMRDVEQARLFCEAHGTPFNYEGWKIVVEEHGGYLPITIEAVAEGTPIPLRNVMVQVTNNDDRLPWVTSYVETLLMSYFWYGSTVATMSREIKRVIKHYLDLTSDNPDAELPFKLHDFGYRGVSPGSAGIGGAAHLVNFMGTDTVAGIEYAMNYYDADVCGFSISASEHSTITSWGEDHEYDAYANMVEQYAKPGAIFACVIDSYDTMRALKMWSTKYNGEPSLFDKVKAAGATVVMRPDSGDPVQMPVDVVQRLMQLEGYELNSKGFAVLPSHIRVIQGDGIDREDVKNILEMLHSANISASNIAFGMGGGLLQKVNRDTFKFAMKACSITIDGEVHDVVKNPVADTGKKSKAGVQRLLHNIHTDEYKTVRADEPDTRTEGWYNALQPVYRAAAGVVTQLSTTFNEVRANAAL